MGVIKSWLAACLAGQEKDAAEVEQFLLAAEKVLRRNATSLNYRRREELPLVTRRLAEFYEARGDTAKAEEWRNRLPESKDGG